MTVPELAFRRSESRNCVGCVWDLYDRKTELHYWLAHGNVKKQQNKLVEFKEFVDDVRIKSPDLKNKCLF